MNKLDNLNKFEFEINCIYTIVSLQDDERNTAEELFFDVIKNFENKYKGFNSFYFEVNSKKDLIDLLENISCNSENKNLLPVIHIEAHGLESFMGIQIAKTKESFYWEEFYPFFSRINFKLKNTLIITTGICFGSNLYINIDYSKPAPFFALIASIDKINSSDIYKNYTDFYNKLMFSMNLTDSLKLLDLNLVKVFGIENLIKVYLDSSVGKLCDENYQTNLSKSVVNFNFIQKNNNLSEQNRNIYNQDVLVNYRIFLINEINDVWKNFLMIEQYPSLINRFINIKQDINDKIANSQKLDSKSKKEILELVEREFN